MPERSTVGAVANKEAALSLYIVKVGRPGSLRVLPIYCTQFSLSAYATPLSHKTTMIYLGSELVGGVVRALFGREVAQMNEIHSGAVGGGKPSMSSLASPICPI